MEQRFMEQYIALGGKEKFIEFNSVYLGNQVECEFGGERCYGVVAGMDFLLVCEYGEDGANPELVVYKRR